MAQKRMFDRAVIDTDRFMDLPVSAKALYFLLGMESDDEGFVSYKKVLRIHGGNEDDIKVLQAKDFVIKFETGVVVITDWRKNNWLDARRIRSTEYVTEKELLAITKDNRYMLSNGLATAKREEYRGEERSIEENSISSELSSQIKEIFKVFYEINPNINWGNKTSRKACEDMIKKFGYEGTMGMAQQVISVHGKAYAPVATTPYEMMIKLSKFKAYFESEKDKLNKNKFSNILKV